ncbi:MAG: hypothetical protein M1378_04995, partial [Bacteroidetes bacterium]|nr:hypothetical protein [Bacteroidota bacterium]
ERIEQLYPFPAEELKDAVKGYKKFREIVWVQEEPENMGAWSYVRPRLQELFGTEFPISYIGRTPNASPADGSTTLHIAHQKEIIERVYRGNRKEIGERSAEEPAIDALTLSRQSVNEVHSTRGNMR